MSVVDDVEKQIGDIHAEIDERLAKIEALKSQHETPARVGIPASVIAIAGFCETDETTYAIDCMRITISNGEYEVAATDARRLAIVRGSYADASVELGITIHPKFIVAAIETCGGNVRQMKRLDDMLLLFSLSDSKVRVRANRRGTFGAEILCEPNMIKFPLYRDVVPKSQVEFSADFSAKLLSDCVLKCGQFSDCDSVRVSFRSSNLPLVIEPISGECEYHEVKTLLMPKVDD